MIYEKTVTIPYKDWKTLNDVLEEIRKLEPRLENMMKVKNLTTIRRRS